MAAQETNAPTIYPHQNQTIKWMAGGGSHVSHCWNEEL